MEVVFSRSEFVALSGVPPSNVTTVTSRRYVQSAIPVTRGQRPIYTHSEVLKMGLMERMRAAGVPYRRSCTLVDDMRARSLQDGEDGVWRHVCARFVPDRLVWTTLIDGTTFEMWSWRPDQDSSREDARATMLGFTPIPADGFRTLVLFDVSELVQRIGSAAQAKIAAIGQP